MSMTFNKVQCQKCGGEIYIETRQEQVWCGNSRCAMYIDRSGEAVKYNPIDNSSLPNWDAFGQIFKK